MSTGKRIQPAKRYWDEIAVTGTNIYLSEVIPMQNMDTSMLEIIWTGTMVGQIVILGSVSGVNFLPLPGFAAISPSGTNGGTLIDIWGTGAHYLQVQYTNASGSGVIDLYAGAKAF